MTDAQRVVQSIADEIAQLRAQCAREQEPWRDRLRMTESEEERWEIGRRLRAIQQAYADPIERLLSVAVALANLAPLQRVVVRDALGQGMIAP